AFDVNAGGHATSAPPPKLKKERKKDEAAKAIDRPNTIWISRRNPPAVSPKASVRPVTMMMITATIFATGPCTDSSTCCRGCSQGMPEPPAQALVESTAQPSASSGSDRNGRVEVRIWGMV